MSIKYISDSIFDIYIKKESAGNVNFNDLECLETYLKELFKILKNKYNIAVEGFYEVTVYIDKNYGFVFHLEKDEIDYYNYFKNQVDMRIYPIETEFLYLADDLPDNYDKFDINIIDNCIYLKIKNELSDIEMMELLENTKLVYDK